jgi:uncharacterized protein (TIGR03000 family)
MRSSKAAIDKRWWKTVFGGSLVALALAGFVLPNGRAEIVNSGGHVQVHRHRDGTTAPVPVRRYVAPSLYPDNDSEYPTDYAAGESARSASSPADGHPYDVSAKLPWNQPDFEDYKEPATMPQGTSFFAPSKYTLKVSTLIQEEGVVICALDKKGLLVRDLPQNIPLSTPTVAVLIAHLPEHAALWVEGIRTRLTGRTRYFKSPLLQPDRKYNYTVRAAWIEDGRWVAQTRIVPVRAGRVQCLYLQSAALVKKQREARAPAAKNPAKASAK